jgi:tetratricopeptide (TPR) repeat protein
MTTIRIRQRETPAEAANASVAFDGGEEFPVTIADPFSKEDEALVEWYFEEHLRAPFMHRVPAQQAAASVSYYGESLFRQVFADPDAYFRYKEALQQGIETLRFEIAGPPPFHALHWEALKDPALPEAFVLRVPMVRKNLVPQIIRAQVRPGPVINVLLIVARPRGRFDVGYRTISRPLVESLRRAGLRVQVDIVRPGTYQALTSHLEQHGAGHYHVVHFDVHGGLLTYAELREAGESNYFLDHARYGRSDIQPYEGQKAFLLLEGIEDKPADPVEAAEVANLLILHQVPVVVLNACQSGKQVGVRETSLGSPLLKAGVQTALAMSYSVTVTAAELMMQTLYAELFAGRDLSTAICRGRRELYNRKGRRAYFDETIDLEDWLLPVVYENRPVELRMCGFTPEEHKAYYERQAARYAPRQPDYGFFGRDLDILQLEKRLLAKRNIVLVSGMGGAGKTTLLQHVAQWWQQTGLVEDVFYYGYDERAWTREQIVLDLAHRLLTPYEYPAFQALPLPAQQVQIAERLRATRHLLILDNLESITGAPMAILNTLPEHEREALRDFLVELVDGSTLVLLGSRGGEEWLAKGTFNENVYDLPGLDEEAASKLADAILNRLGATRYRDDADFKKLLELLDGYPLPIEVVLANLARQKPGEVLTALVAGDRIIDARDRQKKTESIVRCIEYSYGNLSPEARQILLCLAPFTGVMNQGLLEGYTARLKQQKALAGLPFERFPEVVQEAMNWGLLRPEGIGQYLRLQPILPYFLRGRLQASEQSELRAEVETAFRDHYDEFADAIYQLLESKNAPEKQAGLALAKLEYENLATALNLAVRDQVSIINPYLALSSYLDAIHDHTRGLALGETILAGLENYPPETLAGPLGLELVSVIDDTSRRQLILMQFPAAEASCRRALEMIERNQGPDTGTKRHMSGAIHHQLGRVAQEQRQWAQAEQHYKKALDICIEFKNRHEEAETYHQLGRVAQQQRQWTQAEQHLRKALGIYVEFKDRYEQAGTYGQLGIVAQEQRHWAQAERHYRKALEIFIEFKDRYSQARTYHELGVVAQGQGQWVQAERHYQKALEIYIEFKDRSQQAGAYHQLGTMAAEQRQWAQATDYLSKALVIFAEYPDTHNLGMTLGNLARLWEASNDQTIITAVAQVLNIGPDEAEKLLRAPPAAEA